LSAEQQSGWRFAVDKSFHVSSACEGLMRIVLGSLSNPVRSLARPAPPRQEEEQEPDFALDYIRLPLPCKATFPSFFGVLHFDRQQKQQKQKVARPDGGIRLLFSVLSRYFGSKKQPPQQWLERLLFGAGFSWCC